MDKFNMNNTQAKQLPKDAQVIMSILKELNVSEYEPRVINQLLEFSYRYVTCILDDAKVFANHSRKKTIDLEDVKMATEVTLDKSFTCPPPRHILSKLAEVRNAMPLPPIKPHCGLRLPPDRYCLSACNYKLRSTNQPKKMIKSAFDGRAIFKTIGRGGVAANGGTGTVSLLKRTPVVLSKAQVVTIPKPVIRFTTLPKTVQLDKLAGADIKMEMDLDLEAARSASAVGSIAMGGIHIVKRERDEDDFEVVH